MWSRIKVAPEIMESWRSTKAMDYETEHTRREDTEPGTMAESCSTSYKVGWKDSGAGEFILNLCLLINGHRF